jgi:hypothetical protein
MSVVDDRGVIDDGSIDVGGPNYGRVHGYGSGVIRELSAPPLTAGKAASEKAESVVHAAVEADFCPPISLIEEVSAIVSIPPIARRPEIARLWRCDPGSRNPIVVAAAVPGPISGCPHEVRLRAWRLNVDRESRRRKIDADADGDLRKSCRGHGDKCSSRES